MARSSPDARAAVAPPLERNIEALMRRRADEMGRAPLSERFAAVVARFIGSIWSVALHGVIFGFWILANLDLLPQVRPWDPTMVVLGMVASVEAIFLSTFVLINQNRLARTEEERADLALQISLLSEQQAARLVEMVAAISGHMRIPVQAAAELDDLAREVAPDAVLDEIRRHQPDPL
jgi:uncharacterized membrane protein